MKSNDRSRQVRRATGISVPVIVGLVVAGVSLSHAFANDEPFVGRLLSGAALAGLALPLFGFGTWLSRSESDAAEIWRVTGWTLAGIGPITILSLLTAYYQRVEGVYLAETWTIVVWVAGTGAVGGMLTGLYDLRRNRAREDANTTAERIALLAETVPVPIMIHKPDGAVTSWNAAAEDVFGWEANEVNGEAIPNVPADQREEHKRYRQRAEQGETVRGVETRRECKDGSEVDVQVWATPRVGEDGDVEEVLVAYADITRLKQRERALETLQEIGRELVRSRSTDAVFDRAIEAINRLYDEPIAGCWTHDETTDSLEPVCQTSTATEPLGSQPSFGPNENLAWDAYESSEIAIVDDVSVDGGTFDTDATVRSELILPLGKYGVMIIASTEAKAFDELAVNIGDALAAAIETALERADQEADLRLFKRAIEEAGNPLMITDLEGRIEYVNARFEETTGYTREEVQNETTDILQSGKHSEAFYEQLWETILNGEDWRSEFINQRKDGRLYRVEETIAPISDENESITHFVGVQREITDRRLREQRLDVLNRLLRHNLRNAINVIQGRASFLQDALSDPEHQSQARVINQRATSLVELSEKASTVEHLFESEADIETNCDIGALLADCMPSLEADFPDAEIIWTAPEGVQLQANDHLRLAITEAVTNAVRHNDQDTPIVTVSVTPPTEGEQSEWTEIEITDNGPGIPENERALIERGEETPLRHGSGIGLWLLKWVVANFGGDVTIEEATPRGTTLTLRLPSTSSTTE